MPKITQLAELGFEPGRLDSTTPAVNRGDCAGATCSPPSSRSQTGSLGRAAPAAGQLHVPRRAPRHAAAALGWLGLVRT